MKLKRTIKKVFIGICTSLIIGCGLLTSCNFSGSHDDTNDFELHLYDENYNEIEIHDNTINNFDTGYTYKLKAMIKNKNHDWRSYPISSYALTNNTASMSIHFGEFEDYDKYRNIIIRAENAGSASFQFIFENGYHKRGFTQVTKVYEINFGYFKDYDVKFLDNNDNEISSFLVTGNEKITVPTISGVDEYGWINENGDIVRPGEEFFPTTNDVYRLIEFSTSGSKGLIFNEIGNSGYLAVIGYNGFDTDVIIPSLHDGTVVKKIDNEAFKSKQIDSIDIPSTILEINCDAFTDSSVKNVIFNEKSYLKTIGARAFSNCANIEYIDLSNTKIKEIKSYAFNNCTNLQYTLIPSSIKTISAGAFTKCSNANVLFQSDSLKDINLAEGWYGYYSKTWEQYAQQDILDYESNVKKVEENDDFQYVIKNNDEIMILKYKNTSYLDEIDFQDFSLGKVTKIFPKAFKSANIKSVHCGEWLKTIGFSAFEGSNIESIVFGKNLSKIKKYAFANCKNIVNVDFSFTNLSLVEKYAFSGCKAIEYVYFPESINKIEEGVFNGCTKANILFESKEDPQELSRGWYGYYKGTFGNYYTQKDIVDITYDIKSVITNEDFQYGVTKNNDIVIMKYIGTKKDLDLTYVDNKPIVKICAKAFYNANLNSLKIGRFIKTIGQEAFRESSINNITFDNGSALESIYSYAFSKIDGIRSFDLSTCQALKNIKEYAFYSTDALYFSLPMYIDEIGDNAFADNNAHILFEGLDFSNISKLSSIWGGSSSTALKQIKDISYNIECVVDDASLGIYAVRHDKKAVLLQASAGYYTTTKTQNIKEIGGYKIYKIANYAFKNSFTASNNSNVKYINLGNELFEIGKFAFQECSSILTINFDEKNNKINKIGQGAFNECSNLRAIFIPDSIKSIGSNCFYNDTKCIVMFEISNNVDLSLDPKWNGYDSTFLIVQIKNSIYCSVCDVKEWSYSETGNEWSVTIRNNDGTTVTYSLP